MPLRGWAGPSLGKLETSGNGSDRSEHGALRSNLRLQTLRLLPARPSGRGSIMGRRRESGPGPALQGCRDGSGQGSVVGGWPCVPPSVGRRWAGASGSRGCGLARRKPFSAPLSAIVEVMRCLSDFG